MYYRSVIAVRERDAYSWFFFVSDYIQYEITAAEWLGNKKTLLVYYTYKMSLLVNT